METPGSFEIDPVSGRGWDWHTLLTSVLFHLSVVLVFLLIQRNRPVAPPANPTHEQQVRLDPPIEFQQAQPPTLPQPVVPDRPIPLGPDSKQPDAPVAREQGDPTPIPEDAPLAVDPGGEPAATEIPQPDKPIEAQRVPSPRDLASSGIIAAPTSPFGNRPSPFGALPTARNASGARAMGRAGMGTQDTRGFRESFPEAAGQCPEIPDPGVNPDGSPVLFSLVGVVRDHRGRPLPNAHLQLVGQLYATFSDGQGNYRLEFNPKLLEACRVQVVRVSADGFKTSDLQLAVGRRVQSDDVTLRPK
ncbi:MAG: carboxypeptidase regulatory-like domain-containing protein [Gemmatimonadota bacterium]